MKFKERDTVWVYKDGRMIEGVVTRIEDYGIRVRTQDRDGERVYGKFCIFARPGGYKEAVTALEDAIGCAQIEYEFFCQKHAELEQSKGGKK